MKTSPRASSTGYRIALVILVISNLIAIGWIALPQLEQQGVSLPFSIPGRSKSAETVQAPRLTPTEAIATPTRTTVAVQLVGSQSPEQSLQEQGLLILALRDGQYTHLFAYHPLYLPLTRLTNSPWDDRSPSLSPDGTHVAFSSKENGYWNLYLLDLATGKKTRLTDTPEYEGSPTWSPDGQWIAYERYSGTNLDIFIQSLADPSTLPIQLTDDPGVDRSPAWSPQGREIAFVSSRTGDEEIWLARLDNIDDRFINISNNPLARDRYPVWSPDGSQLAWSSDEGGDRRLTIWDKNQTNRLPLRTTAEGDRFAWTPDGKSVISQIRDVNQTGLAAYDAATARLTLPYTLLPGEVYGMVWVRAPLPVWLNQAVHNPDRLSPTPLWQPKLTRTVQPAGRAALVPLDDVTAPQPMLQDAVDEAFVALRKQVSAETGWDALSSLENAFVPLTSPPVPTNQDDWLYTGRAFAVNPLLLSAGWMTVSREDFGGLTYWRVYLKARYQDGSIGAPLTEMAWDFNARYSGEPRAYEQGGKLGQVPAGYWIDLTEIANRYDWQRLPSLTNWRTFFPSIRFNQFVMTGGLEWHQAMAQLYPPEALQTATPVASSTPLPTPTLENTPVPATAAPTPTVTDTSTLQPTWTPSPGQGSP